MREQVGTVNILEPRLYPRYPNRATRLRRGAVMVSHEQVEREITERERYGYEELRARRRLEAAQHLEDLAVVARQMAEDLRGQPGESGQVAANDTAYGRLYWLRTQLGYVVNTLGVGLPLRWVQRVVAKEYGTLLTQLERARADGD